MTNANDSSDRELYHGFLKGDKKAYDQLMIRHGDSLTLYLYGCIHDWQDAEDLMIEAFARIMVRRPHIREDSFKAYLFKTGRNLAMRYHTVKKRIKQFSLDEYGTDISGNELVEKQLEDKERKKILHLCLERIDPQLREALWLVYFEGMSYAEAAAVMRVNPKRIDHLLTRGKRDIRAELEKEGITNAYE